MLCPFRTAGQALVPALRPSLPRLGPFPGRSQPSLRRLCVSEAGGEGPGLRRRPCKQACTAFPPSDRASARGCGIRLRFTSQAWPALHAAREQAAPRAKCGSCCGGACHGRRGEETENGDGLTATGLSYTPGAVGGGRGVGKGLGRGVKGGREDVLHSLLRNRGGCRWRAREGPYATGLSDAVRLGSLRCRERQCPERRRRGAAWGAAAVL